MYSQHLTSLKADVQNAERDGSIDSRYDRLRARLGMLGRQIDWAKTDAHQAALFMSIAEDLMVSGHTELRRELGAKTATALYATLDIRVDYKASRRNVFSEKLVATRPLRAARRGGARARARRPSCGRSRGSRRVSRSSSRGDDPGGGEPEPDDGHLDTAKSGGAR